MDYLPVLLGLVTAVCWGSADYLSRRQSELVGHYRTVLYSHLTTLIFLVAIVAGVSPSITIVPFPLLLLAGVGALNFLAFIYLYRAFHRGVVSVVAPVAYTYPAVTTVLSVLILGSTLTFTRGAGISAVILGVILLSTRISELKGSAGGGSRVRMTSGLGSAVAASVLFGTVYVGVGYATPFTGYALPPIVLRAVAVGVGLLVLPALGASIRPSRAALSVTVFAMGAFESVGFLSFNYGVFLGPDSLPVVAALSGMGGAVAAFYGILFLKERPERNQLVGLALSGAGVFILLHLGG
ncbi:MAG: DMT family transporter [Thaumarchaeota archaeon]|nr:DMT family transporter [Nitrososphaerota archaeon]